MCANECARKYACEGVLFTAPVGYSGSLSAVNETCKKDKGHCSKNKIVGAHLTLPTGH